MSLYIIGAIILLGLLLIMAEVFLIPGTTLVGIVGGIVVVGGVYMAYAKHGVYEGNIALGVSTVSTGILLYLGFKAYSSKKFSLNESIDSKVNVLQTSAIVGDEGITVSNLRPNGKATLNGKKIEVYSLGEYVEMNEKIKVIKITESKIFVEPINQN